MKRNGGEPQEVLRVEDLSVQYGAVRAVRGVSLSVLEGQITSLIGANGAGKSTILNGIMGLVPISGGRVVLAGRDVTGWTPERIVRLGMTLTPEGRRVFPTLSVRENLRLGAVARRGRTGFGSSQEEILELFPVLAERAGQVAGTLSGGEQQQLAIGRSLLSAPRLLLLDEPSLGLAPRIMDKIFELIAGLRAHGLTILLVEQNVTQSLEIADRGYVLEGGVITAEGTAESLRSSTEIARAYLGV